MKITPRQYAKFLFTLSLEKPESEEVNILIKKTSEFIRKNRDEKKIPQIEKIYKEMERKAMINIEAEVITKTTVSEQDRKIIKTVIGEKTGISEEKISINFVQNSEIKGGLIMKIGNEIWDGSIRSKLNRINQELVI